MTTRTLAAMVAGLAGSAAAAHGQTIAFTGAPYTQDFNGLPAAGTATLTGRGPHALQGVLGATGLTGWYGANFTGSSANTEVRAHDGSLAGATGRGVIAYGINGSNERALGALPTSNQISTFGAVFTNASGSVINEIRVSFTGEQWRRGNVLFANTLQFSYGTPASSIELLPVQFPDLDFVGPNLQEFPLETALDGNLNTNKQVIEATLTNLAWQPGTNLAISWTINDLTGQDNGLAIDDFTMSLPGGGGPTGCSPADVATEGSAQPFADGPDGFITGTDFDVFVQAFFQEIRRPAPSGPYIADLTDDTGTGGPDTFITGADFDFFITKFFVGCP